jgi:hypothetical protein
MVTAEPMAGPVYFFLRRCLFFYSKSLGAATAKGLLLTYLIEMTKFFSPHDKFHYFS